MPHSTEEGPSIAKWEILLKLVTQKDIETQDVSDVIVQEMDTVMATTTIKNNTFKNPLPVEQQLSSNIWPFRRLKWTAPFDQVHQQGNEPLYCWSDKTGVVMDLLE